MELHENTEKQESALLVAVDTGNYDVEASLAELYELYQNCGRRTLWSHDAKDRLMKHLPVLVQV